METGTPFLQLGDARITADQFGAKAHILSLLQASGELRIPMGFALDLRNMNMDGSDLADALGEIYRLLEPNGRQLIVRSSAAYEDLAGSMFPGRFASRRDLRTVAALDEGVRYCIKHSQDMRVTEYQHAHHVGPISPINSVIVQEQVASKYAGVAFTRAPHPYHNHRALIEFVKGDATELLAGSALGALMGFDTGSHRESYIQLSGPEYELEDLAKLLDAVLAECRSVEKVLGSSQDIEWVWTDDQVYIVQARPIRGLLPPRGENPDIRPSVRRRSRPKKSLLEHSFGQKVAAETYFQKRGLGAPNAVVIPPEATEEMVDNELAKASWTANKNGTVLRYSFRADAGLDVQFVSFGEGIADTFIAARKSKRHAGIISDYVFVEHAFEAYLSAESLLVEHIPGNWEPPNTLPPDLLIWQGESDKVQAWQYSGMRRATFELPSPSGIPATLQIDVPPTQVREMKRWIRELPSIFKEMRNDFLESLPLNVHFVRAGGEWHFLNIRPTQDLTVKQTVRSPSAQFKPKRLFLVRNSDDLRDWDGKAPVLITHRADDPADSRLATLAAALRGYGIDTVFTTFGILSHPAVVLREFELEVIPLYISSRLIKP